MLKHLLHLICDAWPSRKYGKYSCSLKADTILEENTVYICKPHDFTSKIHLFTLSNLNPFANNNLWFMGPFMTNNLQTQIPCVAFSVLAICVTEQTGWMHIKYFCYTCKSFCITISQHSRSRKPYFYHI